MAYSLARRMVLCWRYLTLQSIRMDHLAKLSLDFSDFVNDAGLGSMIWGRASSHC
jgi:hypothetical protein